MNAEFYMIIPVIAGSLLDGIIGDPYSLPHPIRLFGSLISFFERHLNKGKYRKMKGAFMAIFLISGVFLFFTFLIKASKQVDLIYYVVSSVFFFYGLSSRSLLDEAWKVEKKLLDNDLPGAREQLSWIVGRDTAHLSASQIRIATLETLSENLSDGVVAPLFYYGVAGIPGMMTYKMINTLDSMVGYKNERYKSFGFFSAKSDDLANLIPARITALLMIIVSGSMKGIRFIYTYGSAHASPNSGYPESALAGILDCKFGGPNVYHGIVVEKPFIGRNSRELTHKDFLRACNVNIKVSVISVFLLIFCFWLENL